MAQQMTEIPAHLKKILDDYEQGIYPPSEDVEKLFAIIEAAQAVVESQPLAELMDGNRECAYCGTFVEGINQRECAERCLHRKLKEAMS